MKHVMLVAVLAFATSAGAAWAQANGGSSSDQGYKSGASDSGHTGMSSSRTAPTTPTNGTSGTTKNGSPGAAGTSAGGHQ